MRIILIIFSLLFSLSANALSLRADAPSRYEVQPGDTLWEIAQRYLQYPWEWKQLWHANPKIHNPNHIYPGTILELHANAQKPYIRVLSNGTVKLSPSMRPQMLDNSIPPIPLDDIRPFLNPSLVLDHNLLDEAPYIVALTHEHLVAGQGDEVYVRGLCIDCKLPSGLPVSYAIFRPGGEYRDFRTQESLGYKADLVGYAELVQPSDPAKVVITDIRKGIRINDRVLPSPKKYFDLTFEPKTPDGSVIGSIIDLIGDYTQGAVGQVAVIDRGQDIGLSSGDVLAIYRPCKTVPNPQFPPRKVQLPPERLGEAMVFRTFSHTSFVLVMRSTSAIKSGDTVLNP